MKHLQTGFQRLSSPLFQCIAGGVGIMITALLLFHIQPSTQGITLPIIFDEQSEFIEDSVMIHLGALRPSVFRFIADDCLESLSVNGVEVESSVLPFCDYTQGEVLDIGSLLRTGRNVLSFRIRNIGGPSSFTLRPSYRDNTLIVLTVVLLCSTMLCCIGFIRRSSTSYYALPVVFLIIAAAIRMLYGMVTPHTVRGYDTQGHIEYIEHMSAHWSIPHVTETWESSQPPLYYALAGIWSSVSQVLFPNVSAVLFWQLMSIVLSIITICIAYKCLQIVFGRTSRFPLLLSLLICISWPAQILFASRINNDVLVQPLLFLCVAFLLRYWKTSSLRDIIYVSITCGLAILTKLNALLLVPTIGLIILMHPDRSFSTKIRHGLVSFITIFVLTGWYAIVRIFVDKQDMLIPNVTNLSSNLRIENSWQHLLSFHPLKVLDHPFNNPWSDEARRQFFVEYIFRSSFFGEFSFPWQTAASVLLCIGIIVCIFACIGLLKGLYNKHAYILPILCIAVMQCVGHLALRLRYPYASSQDFRYSLVLIIVASIGMGLYWLYSNRIWRMTATVLSVLFSCISLGWITAVILHTA